MTDFFGSTVSVTNGQLQRLQQPVQATVSTGRRQYMQFVHIYTHLATPAGPGDHSTNPLFSRNYV
jgi:hypothetical protein